MSKRMRELTVVQDQGQLKAEGVISYTTLKIMRHDVAHVDSTFRSMTCSGRELPYLLKVDQMLRVLTIVPRQGQINVEGVISYPTVKSLTHEVMLRLQPHVKANDMFRMLTSIPPTAQSNVDGTYYGPLSRPIQI